MEGSIPPSFHSSSHASINVNILISNAKSSIFSTISMIFFCKILFSSNSLSIISIPPCKYFLQGVELFFFSTLIPLVENSIPYFYKNVNFFTKMSIYRDISFINMHNIFKIYFIYIQIYINLTFYILMLLL